MQNHRHTVSVPVRAMDHPDLARVSRESNYKILAFCASDLSGRQDVAFPHQSEIKVNGGEVKANLRGLKNKPGSTRPVDLTKELRLNPPSYSNNVELTYALTAKEGEISHNVSKTGLLPLSLTNSCSCLLHPSNPPHLLTASQKFYFVVYIVKSVPVIDLVAKLEIGKRIVENTVLSESEFHKLVL